jgi:hypothetical protein
VEVKCYGNIMGAYREHPEAKFLGPDGYPVIALHVACLSEVTSWRIATLIPRGPVPTYTDARQCLISSW